MGIFDKVTTLSVSDLDNAVRAIANYYRSTKLYLSLSNATDAYDYFIREYRDDIKQMITNDYGYCYKYKKNYLIATDMQKLSEESPELFHHFYGVAPGLIARIKHERKPVMFINSIGPEGNTMDTNTYKLVNEFVSMYNDDYVVLSDCTAGIDAETDSFEKATGCRRCDINGNVFYRWN